MELTADNVATSWLLKWSGEKPRSVNIDEMDADLDLGLPRRAPELCLAAIVELLTRIPSNSEDRHFQLLAAGPLEDLLNNHGETLIGEVELLARRDPAFRLLLNGVSAYSLKPPVLARLSKYMGSPW